MITNLQWACSLALFALLLGGHLLTLDAPIAINLISALGVELPMLVGFVKLFELEWRGWE